MGKNRLESQNKMNVQNSSSASSVLNATMVFFGQGLRDMLSSRLFVAITVVIFLVSVVIYLSTGQLLTAILWGLGLELLVGVLIRHHRVLAQELGAITHQISAITQQIAAITQQISTLPALAREVADSSGYTQRLLVELSSDQSRMLESNREVERLMKETGEQLRQFQPHEVLTLLERFDGELRAMEVRFSSLELDMRRMADSSQEHGRTLLAKFDGQLQVMDVRFSSLELDMRRMADSSQEHRNSAALDVATALDRLNLEVRRQLASLRDELNPPLPHKQSRKKT